MSKHQQSTVLNALRTFCEAHESSGYAAVSLNAAYLKAKQVIKDVDQPALKRTA